MFKFDENAWIHVSPLGEYEHSGAGVVQVIDSEAVSAIVEDFKTKAAAENFPGLLMDFDHFSMDTDKSSEAAGWIFDLRADDSGLWAKVRWSSKGADSVKGGDYRLVSPVFPKASECEDLGGGRVRPRSLVTVALTNDPNIKGAKPLTNRASGPADEPAAPAVSPVAPATEDPAEAIKAAPVANRWSNNARMAALLARRAKNEARKARAQQDLQDIAAGRRAERFVLKPLVPLSELTKTAKTKPFFGFKASTAVPKSRYYHDGAWYDNAGNFTSRVKPARKLANRTSGPVKLYKWVIGKTKSGTHCPDCTSRNGQVKTAAEWKALGKPQCGSNCKCKLVPA